MIEGCNSALTNPIGSRWILQDAPQVEQHAIDVGLLWVLVWRIGVRSRPPAK